MTSTSSDGVLGHHAAVHPRLNIDVAEQEVQAAINAAGTFLPRDLPNPPIYSKTNPADAPILTLALTSKTLPLSQGRGPRRHAAGAEDLAAARRRPGQHQRRPEAGGAHPGQSRRRSPSYGLSLEDLRTALAQANVNQAKGNFDGTAPGLHDRRQRPAAVERRVPAAVVAYRNGAPVRLSDVADVVDGAENVKQAAWMNDDAGGDPQHPAPAGRQHHRASSTASRRCCRSCRPRCRRRSTSRS